MSPPNSCHIVRNTGFSLLFLLSGLLLATGCTFPASDSAGDWTMAGEAHHAMGRYDEAVAAYDHATALDPSLGKAWRGRGLSLSMLNRMNEAEESFEKAISLDPADIEAFYFQALSRSRSGDTRGALESLERAVMITPEDRNEGIVLTQAWTLRGDLLVKSGDPEGANASYRKAHEIMMTML